MTEPIATGNLSDALKAAAAAKAALKAKRPATPDEERMRSIELLRVDETLLRASQQMIHEAVGKRAANNNGKGKRGGGLSDDVLKALAKVIAPFIREKIAEAVAPLKAEIAELKARPVLEDAGIWDERAVYRPGQVTIHDGSSWVCKELHSNARPGHSGCWRLLAKRGRDGKNAR